MPSGGDAGRWFRDTLTQLEARQAELAQALAEVEAQLADLRASVPVSPRRRGSNPRRGDTFLRVVKAAVIAVVSLAAVVALMHPQRIREQRYSPRCTVACARPVAHHTPARPGGR